LGQYFLFDPAALIRGSRKYQYFQIRMEHSGVYTSLRQQRCHSGVAKIKKYLWCQVWIAPSYVAAAASASAFKNLDIGF
jgi:hypothetical protein